MTLSTILATVSAVAAMTVASACEASVILHFDSGTGVTATLDLTTSGVDNGFGAQTITGLTGSVSGGVAPGAVTGFIPTPSVTGRTTSPDGRWIFDNWVYASPAQVAGNIYQHGLVDNAGPLFTVGDNEYNLFWNSNKPGGYELEVYNPHTGAYTGNYFGAASVPEPASWALTLLGVGGLGACLRSRRKPVYAV